MNPYFYIVVDNRRKCSVCDEKLVPKDLAIEFIIGAFGNSLNVRSAHFRCIYLASKVKLEPKLMRELNREKLLVAL